MVKNLESVSLEILQERLLEEVEAQRNLQKELKAALENEREIRLENELLWVYLQRTYPGRVESAKDLRNRLLEGGDLMNELDAAGAFKKVKKTSTRSKARRALGKVPGVRQIYHGIKNTRKR